jgi:peptidoglycan/xylan/chitin deacetylase (PgdA/CDA1 family)
LHSAAATNIVCAVPFRSAIYQFLKRADHALSGAQVRLAERRGSLVVLFFHSLFADDRELQSEAMSPQEAMTVKKFREIIEDFLRHDFKIVSIEEVARGLDPLKKHLLLTFDDGYFNNHRALPVLEELNASAVVFVSTSHVREGRPFWWDVLFRIRRGQGWTLDEIRQETFKLNYHQKTEQIEKFVREAARNVPFTTVGELDRPFKPEELREFAATKRIFFENHTTRHAVLTTYSPEEILREIAEAQRDIEEMTGRRPIAIGYPNGRSSPEIFEIARQAGLRLGFTAQRRKNYITDLNHPVKRMGLGRFQPDAAEPIDAQCRFFRSDLMLTERVQAARRGY